MMLRRDCLTFKFRLLQVHVLDIYLYKFATGL